MVIHNLVCMAPSVYRRKTAEERCDLPWIQCVCVCVEACFLIS